MFKKHDVFYLFIQKYNFDREVNNENEVS